MSVNPSRTSAFAGLRWHHIRGFGALAVADIDHHRALTWLAAAGLALAGVLAAAGMPPVSIHFPTHALGIMGPLCGMTRGVAAATRGDLGTAWAFNPGSWLLVGGAVLVLARTAVGAVTGRWVAIRLEISRGGWVVLGMTAIALTANQQAHAAQLLTR